MAHFLGDDVIKEKPKKQTYPNPDDIHRKPQISKGFFSVQTTRLHESCRGLNSSLALVPVDASLAKLAVSGRLMLFKQFLDFC